MRTQVRSLAWLSGSRIRCCCELCCGLQVRLGSGVAVAVASNCSSDSPPGPGTSLCHRCGPKKRKQNEIKKYLFPWQKRQGRGVYLPGKRWVVSILPGTVVSKVGEFSSVLIHLFFFNHRIGALQCFFDFCYTAKRPSHT